MIRNKGRNSSKMVSKPTIKNSKSYTRHIGSDKRQICYSKHKVLQIDTGKRKKDNSRKNKNSRENTLADTEPRLIFKTIFQIFAQMPVKYIWGTSKFIICWAQLVLVLSVSVLL